MLKVDVPAFATKWFLEKQWHIFLMSVVDFLPHILYFNSILEGVLSSGYAAKSLFGGVSKNMTDISNKSSPKTFPMKWPYSTFVRSFFVYV